MSFLIEKTYQIAASVSRVYQQWICEETIVPPAVRMEIEAKVGGKYILVSQFGEQESVMTGIFEKVEPDTCLVYTWEWEGDGNVSKVTVKFSSHADGTRIDLIHAGLHDQQSFNNHDAGWDSYIVGFKKYLT